MKRCIHGGYLVDGSKKLPSDPSVFFDGDERPVGCNRIRCAECASMVRHIVGMELPERMRPEEIKAVYEAPELKLHPALRAGSRSYRQYLCRCRKFFETRHRALDDPDPEPMQAPNLPWKCAGHPSP
jgi:hypothetical protein